MHWLLGSDEDPCLCRLKQVDPKRFDLQTALGPLELGNEWTVV